MVTETFGRGKGVMAKHEEFEAVALVHVDILYNTALRMTQKVEDAEDLVQETFVRAYRFFDRFQKGTNCKAWLFKIMKNCFINKYRKECKTPSTVSFDEIEGVLGVESEPKSHLRSDSASLPDLDDLVDDDVKEALESLPLEFKMAVILSDISGFSYKEVAGIMETPIGTVRSRLSRARSALQRKLYGIALRKGIVKATSNELAGTNRLGAYAASHL